MLYSLLFYLAGTTSHARGFPIFLRAFANLAQTPFGILLFGVRGGVRGMGEIVLLGVTGCVLRSHHKAIVSYAFFIGLASLSICTIY